MKRNIPLLVFLLVSVILPAQTPAAGAVDQSWGLHPMLVMIIFVITVILMLLTLMLALQLYRFLKKSAGEIVPELKQKEKKKKTSLMHKLMQLKPLEQEKDMLTDHEYDGIRELNNPTPAWFMALFYGTILFAAVYLVYYHVMDNPLMEQEYLAEMEKAQEEKAAWQASQPQKFNEDSVRFNRSPSIISEGKIVFDQFCIQCHGQRGEGKVGPNLTDEYWLHGNTAKDIFRTIREGVPDKGMIAWKSQLKPDQIVLLVSYIKSLEGTNPAGAKEPQGEKLTPPVEDAEVSANKSEVMQ